MPYQRIKLINTSSGCLFQHPSQRGEIRAARRAAATHAIMATWAMSLAELAGPLTDFRTNGRGLGLEQLYVERPGC